MKTLRTLSIAVAAAALLSACATSTVPSPLDREAQKPRVNAAYRDMAAYLMGKRGDAIKVPPDRDLTARIQLEPTPGRLQKRHAEGQYWGEVLTSGPGSDAYVTTAHWMPITRYFRLLREVDCDTRMWIFLVSPKMIRANPAYLSGISRDQDPSYGCEKHFHERFKAGNDPQLAGADGVIIDQASFEDRGANGFFINQLHVFMRAYAIKFDEPTDADIVMRLTKRAVNPVDLRQTQAVAYWIEKHRAKQYQALMRRNLPRPGSMDMAFAWDEGRVAIEQALAALGDLENNALWMDILQGSKVTEISGLDPNAPIPMAGLHNEYVAVAGNALACTGDVRHVEELLAIVKTSARLPHKLVAAQVLGNLGRGDLLDEVSRKIRWPIQNAFIKAAKGERHFTCPFEVTYGQ